ncbi:hypothetical protein Arub01_43010 [Actinomadura rubrobrunea]|uniref:non-specific serine/threonine protein kinase n=1 Tax=Actinomadura rubrobrunea TaxID=115335 RepID=A0A9W6Q0J2_9ACTN|nr:hypothetical protein Arub01_43010 [Actinomadura rubrobrunea]
MADSGGSRVLADRYVLLERLGSGGMGTVWRATDRLLSRTVAIKEMHLLATGEELDKQAARARREAHTIARISHPNVVNVYDLVEQDERLWLVMELVDGPSLKDHVKANGPMSPSAVADIGLQLLSALEAVHAAGVLHRDLKPGNVLLRRDGKAVLCDFGVAALAGAESITTTGAVVGSLGYIAPERLSGGHAGPPSDLFSLGVTLCALLSGRPPFARPEAAGVINAVLREDPEIPAAAGPLRALLEALLRKNPADRPSIAEAREMLRSLTTTATATPDVSKATRKWNTAPRRTLLGLAALLCAAVLLGVAVTTGVLMSRLGSEADALSGAVASARSSGQDSMDTTRPTPVDAVMPVPGDPGSTAPGDYWMFSDDTFIRFRAAKSDYPVRRRHTAVMRLKEWDDTFENLPESRKKIDAALPVPGSADEYWVFSGSRYIRIRLTKSGEKYEDTLVAGPRPLTDWKNAFGELTAKGIDAVMPTPDDPTQYWVFAGDQYVRTRLDGEGPGGQATYGPSGLDAWTGTFNRFPDFRQKIDAVLPVPGARNDYWVFSGTRYMKIRVTDVEYKDTVLEGLHNLLNWTALD